MGHILASNKSRFDRTPSEWLTAGSQINDLVNTWAKRSDIVTFVGEGAGVGHPACFVPAIAEMEVNVSVAFGEDVDPRFIGDLSKRSVQFDHPVAMGAILHEAMHAKHSHYDLSAVASLPNKFVSTLITNFEETRIEARGVAAFPENRAFLRACALRLVIGDLREDEDFTGRGVQAFSTLILLTLARVDAGVLDPSDVEPIQDAAVKFLGEDVLSQLRSIWIRAQAHSVDSDWKPQETLAHEWIKVLEESGNDPSGDPDELPEWLKDLLESLVGSGEGEGEGEDEGGSGGSGGSDGLLEAMADAAATDAQTEANRQAVKEVMDELKKAREAAAKEFNTHRKTAARVFGRGTGPGPASTSSQLIEERDPSPQERAAAVALSKELEKARYRDRVVVKRGSVVPPGRLHSRGAIAAAEQRSRGAEVTAEPWSRKQRFHTEDPELKIGVLVDISGSMGMAMEPMASTAWVLSEATRRVQGKCAMVYYGNDVFATLKPGQHMPKVRVYSAPDGTEKFDDAFKALNGTLDLLGTTGARLLVVVSDLVYTGYEGQQTLYWMERCRRAGVAVIVVPFDYEVHAIETVKKVKGGGVEVVPNATTLDVIGAAKSIGAYAVKNLQKVGG